MRALMCVCSHLLQTEPNAPTSDPEYWQQEAARARLQPSCHNDARLFLSKNVMCVYYMYTHNICIHNVL